ncbi:MAG: PhnD/SsuA/transferrin family substrate-binding protein, partial [Cyanobacteria bacterium J06639_18]
KLIELISQGTVDAGAISKKNFERYRQVQPRTNFRIIHEGRYIPSGVVLLAPTVERNREQQIRRAMEQAPAHITADAGYVPSAKIPNYKQFIKLVEKVRPLEQRVEETPAVLLYPTESTATSE